jgi:integrase
VAVRKIGQRYYISLKWKGNRIETASSARNEAEAKKIEKSVKTAFKIYRFDHLDPASMEVVIKTFENKGWKLPPELSTPDPKDELTLVKAIEEYVRADEKHRRERNLFAIDRLIEHFGGSYPLTDLKVRQIKAYRNARLQKVTGATVNREMAVLSGIFRVQVEADALEYNPCRMLKGFPENERDSYLSWKDFNRLSDNAGWLRDIVHLIYYTGMRFGEAVNLRWEMFKPERRMLILPPSATKEGKSHRISRLRAKRVPLRFEVLEMLESLRKEDGGRIVHAAGLVFGYSGHYKTRSITYSGKPVTYSMVRKCWARALSLTGMEELQFKDLRHTWKTNAQRSGMHPAIANAIVGHRSARPVEDRYIRVSDEDLLRAVDSMSFDHGVTELDFVDEFYEEGLDEKGTEEIRKMSPAKSQVKFLRQIPLDNSRNASVL